MNKYIFVLMLLAICSATDTAAHPYIQYGVKDVRAGYDTGSYGYPPAWSFGSVKYHPHPTASSLSTAERYMLFGTRESSHRGALTPWWSQIFDLVSAYDQQHNQIPEVLGLSELKSIRGLEDIEEQDKTALVVRSPITGEYPRLRETSFSKGNLLIRRLTKPEIEGLSVHDQNLRMLHFEKKFMMDSRNGKYRPAELTSPVYYIVVYGDEGIIESRLAMSFKFTDKMPPLYVPDS